MPQLSYSVPTLQQTMEIASAGDLTHANNVLNLAKKGLNEGHRLKCLHLESSIYLNVYLTDQPKTRKVVIDTSEKDIPLGMATVHDASFMGQPNEASQQAYVILLAMQDIPDGRARTHLLDWGSPSIHKIMHSALACDNSSAARAC